MSVYIILIFFLLPFYFAKKKKLFYILFFIILFLIAGGRGESVGKDVIHYKGFYNDIKYYFTITKGFEYGWYYLNKFVYEYFDNFQFLLYFSSFLILLPLFIACKKDNDNPLLSILFYVLLYFYYNSFNIIRQSIAMSFTLLSFTYIDSKKFIKFLFFILIAMLFHTSAILLLPVYFLKNINFNKIFITFILIITYFIGGSNLIINLLFNIITIINMYANYTKDALSINFSITRLLLNILIICLISISDIKSIYMKLLIIGIIILNLFPSLPNIGRIAQYFLLSQILIYPNINITKPKLINKNITICILIIYGLFVYFFMLNHNISEVVPYVTFS